MLEILMLIFTFMLMLINTAWNVSVVMGFVAIVGLFKSIDIKKAKGE